jgi:hypothetical protein
MALQVRRGTNAERLGITPAEGELIFTTDTKQLYVGDGTTAGGITSIAGTIDSLLADSTPQLGGTLDLNNHDITGTGNINITGTIQASGNINLGDGVGSDIINIGGVMSGDLVPNADATHDLGSTTAYWKEAFISQLSVDSQITAERVQADIIADDSTIAFDSATGNITGNVTGNTTGYHTGDITGSVFADDSSILVDAVNSSIVGNIDTLRHVGVTTGVNNAGLIVTGIAGASSTGPKLEIKSSNGTTANPTVSVGGSTGDGLADIHGLGFDGAAYKLAALMRVAVDLDTTVASNVVPGRINFVTADSTGNLANLLTFNSRGKLGIGLPRPDEKLHVNGNAKVAGFVQFGSLTTVERDALTAANGMVIYNTTDNKFQGYENGAWTNLI